MFCAVRFPQIIRFRKRSTIEAGEAGTTSTPSPPAYSGISVRPVTVAVLTAKHAISAHETACGPDAGWRTAPRPLAPAQKIRNSDALRGQHAAGDSRAASGETAMESLIVTLVIGAIAGWLAAKVLKGTAFGLIGDIIVGVIGGYIGTWLWDVLHLPPVGGFPINAIVTSTVGAIVLLVLLRLIKS
jgi:uncharacterized membrane protein YeaQ/YmgE (transglycosylase-associated protein family)